MISRLRRWLRNPARTAPSCYTYYLEEYLTYHDYTNHGLRVIREFIELAKFLNMKPPSWDYLYDDMWREVQPYNGELKQFIRFSTNRYKYRYVPIKNHSPRWLYRILVKLYIRFHHKDRGGDDVE